MQIQAYSKLQVEVLLRHLIKYVDTYGDLNNYSHGDITDAWEFWSGNKVVNEQTSFSDYLYGLKN